MSTGAPQERGVSIRMPSAALLCVDSADSAIYNAQGYRIKPANPSDLYINKQQTLMFGYMTRVALTEINFQWDIPNVNEINNTLTIIEYNNTGTQQGLAKRIVFEQGWYKLPNLLIELQLALNNAIPGGSTTTVINGPFVGTYNISLDGFSIYDVAAANTDVVLNNPVIKIERTDLISGNPTFFQIVPYNQAVLASSLPPLHDDLTKMLGITPTLTSPIYYSSIEGSYASTQYTPYVDIVSNLLTKNQNVADNSSAKASTGQKLARVYLSNEQIEQRVISFSYDAAGAIIPLSVRDNAIGVSPFVFKREFVYPKQIQWNTTENIDVIDLQVLDSRGNILPVAGSIVRSGNDVIVENTADFQFTVQVSEI